MNLSLIRSMTRSAVFELENGKCFRPEHPFAVALNGKTIYESCNTNVFSLFSLTPSTAYTVEVDTEGEHLKNDLIDKLTQMNSYVDFIEQRSPQIIAEYRSKLQTKIQDLLADAQIDESRIATEVTLFADKICVDEEMVRLRSHIKGMKEVLITGGSVGRKLDFIAQEMNREANTILSKSNDLSISDTGINLKIDIEKVREQIQNIE